VDSHEFHSCLKVWPFIYGVIHTVHIHIKQKDTKVAYGK